MISLLGLTFTFSLFDSLSTTFQIILFVLLLTTEKPVRNCLVYLVGLSGSYFICGFGGYFVLDQLMVFIRKLMPSSSVSNTDYYQSELITGFLMIVGGFWYFFWKKKKGWSGTENKIIAKLKHMNDWVALGLGVFMSVSSFPMSVPYLITLGKYASAHLDLPSVMSLILFYNLGYALPMLIIFGIYLSARRGVEDMHDQLHQKAHLLNLHLTAWTLVAVGLFSLADAGCFFLSGQALLKDRFF